MKLLTIIHKNISYEFRLLESVHVIEITKGDKFTYLIRWSVSFFNCNCPGSTYHHKCWHTNMISLLKQQPSIDEPWAEWAEEAGRMMYSNNERMSC